jgi:hypothetical protein
MATNYLDFERTPMSTAPQQIPPIVTKPTPADAGSLTSGWKSSEFVATATIIVTNVLGLAAVLWHLNPEEVANLNGALTAIIGAVGVAGANALVVWRFIASRHALKVASIAAEASIQNTQTEASATNATNSQVNLLATRLDKKNAVQDEILRQIIGQQTSSKPA